MGQLKYTSWQIAWQDKKYRIQLIVGLLLLIVTLVSFPSFFNYIEDRNGIVLNDWLLEYIPVMNLSTPIFGIIWLCAGFTIYKAIKSPGIFILFLWSFLFLSLSRIVSISLVPFNPPPNLIPLVDPLSNTFYGGRFLTKDLFYSGHTATMFLMFLCLEKKTDKLIPLIATILIGVMVLLQRVHYTIDVIAAPPLTFCVYWLAKRYLL